MRWGAISWSIMCALVVSACDGDTSANQQINEYIPANALAAEPPKLPLKPPPRYDEKEGDTYFYIGDVSEEEQKQGKALGSVVGFRYIGLANDTHKLQMISDTGVPIVTYECPTTCKIIKRRSSAGVERLPYDPDSIIGAAFSDALAGNLQIAKGASSNRKTAEERPSSPLAVVPAAFLGEWNEDLSACGTGNNDTRLRIEPGRMRFYESDGEVTKIATPNSRTLKATLSLVGEGQTWTDTVTLVLSRSGDDLTSGGLTRHRCSD